MSYEPASELELKAAEQRKRLHNSIVDVTSIVKEKTDVHRIAAKYALPASGIAGLIALIAGYGFAGIFARR